MEIELYLEHLNVYASKEEQIHTEQALGKLYEFIKSWYIEEGMKQGLTREMAEEAGFSVETFGSYRLGVHGPGSDIDMVCIFPRHITKKIFFDSLPLLLASCEDITDLNPIPDAYVPIIATKWQGIEVDLLFARLSVTTIPKDWKILSDDNLKDIDDETQRSLRGPRDADMILRLVPDIQTFRITLRCVKVWASKRAISTQKYGYLGGVSWAILVAFICQLYPNAVPSVLLHRFFRIYREWPWRGSFKDKQMRSPVLLTEVKFITDSRLKVWQQKKDDCFGMSVITPSFPSMNSTFGVSPSITRILVDEFERGFKIMESIKSTSECLVSLCEETDFFVQYVSYLEIETSADTEEEKIKWESFIESKIRKLIEKFHDLSENFVIHPYPNAFEKEKNSSCVYIGLKLPKQKGSTQTEVNILTPLDQFKIEISKWPHRTPGMKDAKTQLLTQAQIPKFVIDQLSEAQQTKIAEARQQAIEKKARIEQARKLKAELKSETDQTKVEPQVEAQVGEKRKESEMEEVEAKKVKVE